MQKTLSHKAHKHLVKFLIQARNEAGLTQTELALALGEYQSFVARLESGQRRVDVIELIQIAEIVKFDVSDLIAQLQDQFS